MEASSEITTTISGRAARLAIAAIIGYQFLLAAVVFARQDLEAYWHTISEWAIGPYGWVMTLAFELCALSYASLFIAIRSEIRGTGGKIGLGILVVCVIGTVGVGAFITDPMDTPPEQISTTGLIHMFSGMSQLMLLPFAALLINLNLVHRNPAWMIATKPLLWTAALPLLGLLGFIVHLSIYIVPLGETAYGPEVPIGYPPRILFLTYMVWVITLATQALRVRKQKSISPR